MNCYLDTGKNEPVYIQLYRHFVNDIISGVYSYGDKLPSKRTVAEEAGVSVITAEHALGLLCEEGYIESRQRSGYYVIYSRDDFVTADGGRNGKIWERSGTDTIAINRDNGHERLRADSDSLISFPVVAKTMRKVLLDYEEGIFERSPNQGSRELRQEICSYLARSRGIYVSPEQIVIGSGAEYLYGLIVQLLGTERKYAVEGPSYNKIQQVYKTLGADVEVLNLTSDGISSEDLARTKAQILHVTPFHSFPSGVTAGISKKHEYIRWAKSRGGILIEDNYDSELTVSRKQEEPLFSMADGADVIYINTFSKTVAPSIRMGYMILPLHMVGMFNDKLGFYSCSVSTFDQLVLALLIKNGDFERHINRVRRRKRAEDKKSES